MCVPAACSMRCSYEGHCSAELYSHGQCVHVPYQHSSSFSTHAQHNAQTGTGKSHTMTGQPGEQAGIIPRSFHHIFEGVEGSSDTQWMVRASFLEIYNEEVRFWRGCGAVFSWHGVQGLEDAPKGAVAIAVPRSVGKRCSLALPLLSTVGTLLLPLATVELCFASRQACLYAFTSICLPFLLFPQDFLGWVLRAHLLLRDRSPEHPDLTM